MTDLHLRHCQPLEGHAPMSRDDVERHLQWVEGWQWADGFIERRFEFPDFHRTMGFMNAVAWMCNSQDHHPDVCLSYGHCTVRFNTHSVGGISINDFICAARTNVLARDGARA